MNHSISAWRNSDSLFVFIGKPWIFTLAGTASALFKVPPRVEVKTNLAAAALETTPEATQLQQILQQAGVRPALPLYLKPTLRNTLPSADLRVQVTPNKNPAGAPSNEVTISGVVPADAKVGDRFLVLSTARYENKTVEFLHTLYVKG